MFTQYHPHHTTIANTITITFTFTFTMTITINENQNARDNQLAVQWKDKYSTKQERMTKLYQCCTTTSGVYCASLITITLLRS